MYKNIESLCCVPETNIILYVDYNSIKNPNNLDFIKIKNIRASKDAINRVKRQHAEWEKIFAKHISDKELIRKICREY